MYDKQSGEYRGDQVGSFFSFEKVNDEFGVSLYGVARIPKSRKRVCTAITEMWEKGKLSFSFEISYTMKGVALGNQASAPVADSPAPKMQKSVDDNSLYEALKRRAKDVSQMDMPNAGNNNKPKQSGAFDFNRGLSKSGVFSLTGSRVDIDPLSETEYFKALYDKYIQTQKECGEVTDKFTLEQFVSRLAREKDRLMKTYKCKNVRFSVYVKDGKASLKATPQK